MQRRTILKGIGAGTLVTVAGTGRVVGSDGCPPDGTPQDCVDNDDPCDVACCQNCPSDCDACNCEFCLN